MQSPEPDFVILALARWDAPYSSTAFSLAKALSATRRVFLIDNPFTFKDLLFDLRKNSIRKRFGALVFRKKTVSSPLPELPNFHSCVPPLMLPINWLPAGRLYNFFLRLNQKRMNQFLRSIIQRHKIQAYFSLNIFNPFYPSLSLHSVSPIARLYYCVDNMEESAYIKKHGPKLEKQILPTVDLVLTTSQKLTEDLQKLTPQPVLLLPNAANVELFGQALETPMPRPPEFSHIKKPIAVYVGAIGIRIDFDLLEAIIAEQTQIHFVFIGPVYASLPEKLSSHPQLSFLGPVEQAEIPAYLQHADLAIIPFKINELTQAIYPLKIHEYLTAGLPVVSTPFSPDIRGFSEQILLASQASEFAKKLQEALSNNTPEQEKNRREHSKSHSWKKRAQQLDRYLKQFMSG